MNTLSIDWPCGAEAPSLFCPACGKQTVDWEDGLVEPHCPHLKFLYLTQIDDFEFIKEDVKDLLDEKRRALDASKDDTDEDQDELSDYELLQSAVSSDPTFVIFELTTSGMACGPVSSTACIGYQLFEED